MYLILQTIVYKLDDLTRLKEVSVTYKEVQETKND